MVPSAKSSGLFQKPQWGYMKEQDTAVNIKYKCIQQKETWPPVPPFSLAEAFPNGSFSTTEDFTRECNSHDTVTLLYPLKAAPNGQCLTQVTYSQLDTMGPDKSSSGNGTSGPALGSTERAPGGAAPSGSKVSCQRSRLEQEKAKVSCTGCCVY